MMDPLAYLSVASDYLSYSYLVSSSQKIPPKPVFSDLPKAPYASDWTPPSKCSFRHFLIAYSLHAHLSLLPLPLIFANVDITAPQEDPHIVGSHLVAALGTCGPLIQTPLAERLINAHSKGALGILPPLPSFLT